MELKAILILVLELALVIGEVIKRTLDRRR